MFYRKHRFYKNSMLHATTATVGAIQGINVIYFYMFSCLTYHYVQASALYNIANKLSNNNKKSKILN